MSANLSCTPWTDDHTDAVKRLLRGQGEAARKWVKCASLYTTGMQPNHNARVRRDPFTITDAHSRYLIRCQIVSRMDLSQVRAICEAATREYGVPARIRTDNGAPLPPLSIWTYGLLIFSETIDWAKPRPCWLSYTVKVSSSHHRLGA
jgi:transposase InsO family protein